MSGPSCLAIAICLFSWSADGQLVNGMGYLAKPQAVKSDPSKGVPKGINIGYGSINAMAGAGAYGNENQQAVNYGLTSVQPPMALNYGSLNLPAGGAGNRVKDQGFPGAGYGLGNPPAMAVSTGRPSTYRPAGPIATGGVGHGAHVKPVTGYEGGSKKMPSMPGSHSDATYGTADQQVPVPGGYVQPPVGTSSGQKGISDASYGTAEQQGILPPGYGQAPKVQSKVDKGAVDATYNTADQQNVVPSGYGQIPSAASGSSRGASDATYGTANQDSVELSRPDQATKTQSGSGSGPSDATYGTADQQSQLPSGYGQVPKKPSHSDAGATYEAGSQIGQQSKQKPNVPSGYMSILSKPEYQIKGNQVNIGGYQAVIQTSQAPKAVSAPATAAPAVASELAEPLGQTGYKKVGDSCSANAPKMDLPLPEEPTKQPEAPTTKETTTTTTTEATTTTTPPTTTECEDLARHCKYWSENKECDKNPAYMNYHCRMSCGKC